MNGRNPADIVENGYDRIAQDYHDQRDKFKSDELLHNYAALLPPGGRLLDVGCGAGIPVVKSLVNAGYEVTGVDISSSMLQLARVHVPRARFLKMDMSRLGFRPASFDGLSAFYSFFHIPEQEQFQVIASFSRLLRPAGVLLFCTGVDAWEGVELFHGAPMYWSNPGHEVTRTRVLKAGFELLLSEVREYGGEQQYWVMARKKSDTG